MGSQKPGFFANYCVTARRLTGYQALPGNEYKRRLKPRLYRQNLPPQVEERAVNITFMETKFTSSGWEFLIFFSPRRRTSFV